MSVDYIGHNTYWNGSSWLSYAAGYGSVLGPNTSTGDFTIYTTGSAASAGLIRTLTPVLAVTNAGTVSATAFVGNGSGLTNVAASSLSWYGLTRVPTQVAAVSNSGAISLSGLTMTGAVAMGSNGISGLPGGVGMGGVSAGWYSDTANLAARPPSGSGDFYIQNTGGGATYARIGAGAGGAIFPVNMTVGSGNGPASVLDVYGDPIFRSNYIWFSPTNTSTQYQGIGLNSAYSNGNGVSFIDARRPSSQVDSALYFNHFSDKSSAISFLTSPAGADTDHRAERMRIDASGNVGIGTTGPSFKLDVNGDINATGWLRSTGNAGWYSQTYGGGWYMTDSTWIRSYNSKPVYMETGLDTNSASGIGCGGGLGGGFMLHVCGTAKADGNLTLGSAVFQTDGNIYMPWAGDYLSNILATKLYSGGTFGGDNVLNLYGTAPSYDVWSPALEVREVNQVGNTNTNNQYAPGITFHWSNVAASAIKMYADASIRFKSQNTTETSYSNIYSNNLWISGLGDWITNGFLLRYVNQWITSSEGNSRFYFASGARTYIRANNGDGQIVSFRGGDEVDKVHIAQDGNIYTAKLGVWLSDWFNQSVRSDATPTFSNLYLSALGDWITNRLGQDVRSGASPTFGTLTATLLKGGGSNGDALYIGDDAKLADINVTNTAQLYGQADGTVGSLKLGSAGGTISGYNGNIGIGTTAPTTHLDVSGTSNFTKAVAGYITSFNVSTTTDSVGIGMYGYPSDYGTSYLQDTLMMYGNTNTTNLQLSAVNPSGVIRFTTGGYISSSYERMRIDNSGNVGIGTTAPAYKLDINGDVGINGAIVFTGSTGGLLNNTTSDAMRLYSGTGTNTGAFIYLYGNTNSSANAGRIVMYAVSDTADTTNASIYFLRRSTSGTNNTLGYFTGSGEFIVPSGNVQAPTLKMTAPSSAAGTNPTCWSSSTKQLSYSTSCTASDIRLKTQIAPLSGSLEKIGQLQGVSFLWKDPKTYGDGRQIGLVAQSVETVFPEVVKTNSDGLKSVKYEALVAPLIEAVKQLKADNDNLAKESAGLRERLDRIERHLDAGRK